MIDFIKRVIVTQKSTTLLESERYTFDVDVHLKKTDIKALVEDLYDVKVISVNTHRLHERNRHLVVCALEQSAPLFA